MNSEEPRGEKKHKYFFVPFIYVYHRRKKILATSFRNPQIYLGGTKGCERSFHDAKNDILKGIFPQYDRFPKSVGMCG